MPSWGLWLALGLGAGCLGESLPANFPLRRGPMAFVPACALARVDLPREELDWLCRFDLVVTNGYDAPCRRTLDAFHASGTHLFRYFWLNGFPQTELHLTLGDGQWRQELLRDHSDWLLSPHALDGPPGTPPSYYFDLNTPDVVEFLCALLKHLRIEGGYGGVFFDYAGAYALPEEALKLWQRRHPDLPYDRAVAGLLGRLREVDPEGLIFTNQACRSQEPLLPLVDADMVESYATSFAWGPVVKVGEQERPLTFLRPWEGPAGLEAIYGDLHARLQAARPRRAFICLDYMRAALPSVVPTGPVADGATPAGHAVREEPDVEAVYYSYGAAALWGLDAFCSGWHGIEYRGPLYFADLGAPRGDGPTQRDGLVWREYTRGLVALLARPEAAQATVPVSDAGSLYDLLAGRRVAVRGGEAVLRLQPSRSELTDEPRPIARVYLKVN